MNATPPGGGLPVLLAFSLAMLALAMDPIVPSLPAIRADFGTDVPGAQLVMSTLVVGFGIAQIVFGPLSDRIGRRRVLLGGWILFVVASVACAFAQSLGTLILWRTLQAIGCCAPVVVGRAVVRDVYGFGHTARMLGLIMAIGAIPMCVAPFAGGLVEQHLGWRWNFGWLSMLGATMLAATLVMLPETNRHRDPAATDARRIFGNYATLVRDGRFIGHTLAAVGNFTMIFSFLSSSSFVLISLLGLAPSALGIAVAVSNVGFATTSLLSSRLVPRFGTTRMLTIGAWIVMPAGTTMAALALAGVQSISALLAPYIVILIGVGFINSSAVAGAITPFPKIAGTASSLLGLIQFATGGFIGYLVARFHDGTPVPMTVAVATGAWCIFLAVYLIIRPLKRQQRTL